MLVLSKNTGKYGSGPTLEEALITFLGEALRKWKAHTMPKAQELFNNTH
jgi:hypothetical protein